MGGAGVAVTRGVLSTYWNPAALCPPLMPESSGFFELALPLAVMGAASRNALRQLDEVGDLSAEADFRAIEERLAAGRPLTSEQVRDLLSLAEELPELEQRVAEDGRAELRCVVDEDPLEPPAHRREVGRHPPRQSRCVPRRRAQRRRMQLGPDERVGMVDGGVLPDLDLRAREPAHVEAVEAHELAGTLDLDMSRARAGRRSRPRTRGARPVDSAHADAGSAGPRCG